MSPETINLRSETTARELIFSIMRETQIYSLPEAVRKVIFSKPKDLTNYQNAFTPVDAQAEIPWAANSEKWNGGERNFTAYPWSLSARRTDGEDTKYLTRHNDEFVFSGIMPVLDFDKMLDKIIEEKGRGLGLVDVGSVSKELAMDIAVNQESVDFSKIKVSFEFKFLKKGYKLLKAEVL